MVISRISNNCGHISHGEILKYSKEMKAVLGRGMEGRKEFKRSWNVLEGKVRYLYEGKDVCMYGFEGYETVFSLIREEKGKLTACFYPEEDLAGDKSQLLSIFILAERIGGHWKVLAHPQVVSARQEKKRQFSRIFYKSVHDFLVKAEEGVFKLGECIINNGGEIELRAGSAESECRGVILIPGYVEYLSEYRF